MRADALEAAIARGSRARARCPARSSRRPAPRRPRRSTRSTAIAAIARRHGVWLHVDAAMAGLGDDPAGVPLDVGRRRGRRLARLNAHKWLGAAFDCSLYYVRDPEHLVRVMCTNPSYLQTAADGRVKNLRDWGIPLGRRFRALKLWCLHSRAGRRRPRSARLRRDLENAHGSPTGARARRAGACWRRCRCRRCACATSRRGSPATRSTATRWRGRSG